jgi:hypothetical protein
MPTAKLVCSASSSAKPAAVRKVVPHEMID